ncbi:MAG: hypothetical protein WCD57_16155 [Acidobacteriaceae bacterium]
MTVFEDKPEEPLLGIQLKGVIAAKDPTLPGFCLKTGDERDAMVVVKAEGWIIAYSDEVQPLNVFNPPDSQFREAFVLSKPGISIALSAAIGS